MTGKIAKVLLRLGKKLGLDNSEKTRERKALQEREAIATIPRNVARAFFPIFIVATALGMAVATVLTLRDPGTETTISVVGVMTLTTKILKEFSSIAPGLLAATILLSYPISLTGGTIMGAFQVGYNFIDRIWGEAAMERRFRKNIGPEYIEQGRAEGYAQGVAEERERQRREKEKGDPTGQ